MRARYPGAARNVLLDDARGEWLLFLDDDVTVRPDLLARLAALAEAHPDVDVFGGPNDSPEGSTRFQFVQGAAMASMAGAGPVRRRYGAHPAGPADERFFILCNLAVRRSAMRPFDPDLVCAEENALLSEMSRRGIAMHYDPELAVFHERRDTFSGFGRQMYKYGRGRGQLMVRTPATASPAYLVPSALLAYGALLPIAAALTRGRMRAGWRSRRSRPTPRSSGPVPSRSRRRSASPRRCPSRPRSSPSSTSATARACCAASPNAGDRGAEPVVSAWIDATDQAEPTRVLVEPA